MLGIDKNGYRDILFDTYMYLKLGFFVKIRPTAIVLGLLLNAQVLYSGEVRDILGSFDIKNVNFLADTIRIFNKSDFDRHCIIHFFDKRLSSPCFMPVNVLKNEEKQVPVKSYCTPISMTAYNLINVNNRAYIDVKGMRGTVVFSSNAHIMILFTHSVYQTENILNLSYIPFSAASSTVPVLNSLN